MARYSGKVGFSEYVEIEPGIWEDQIIERTYKGDITRNINRIQTSNNINDNMILSNNITIVTDPYANRNIDHIKYITYMGVKWKITDVEIQYPRIILTTGGRYNE